MLPIILGKQYYFPKKKLTMLNHVMDNQG